MMTRSDYTPVIGLEIHVELNTQAKMFCHCPADHFKAKPNTNICPVCLGLPGTMPYPNRLALKKTLLIATLLNCRINRRSRFERKHYFYPDLPKGYQLTQYLAPLGYQGYLEVEGKKWRIRRVHQEEDTAKLKHATLKGRKVSLIDFNRSGVPLVEIVTEPDFTSSKAAVTFLKQLKRLLKFYQVSDCDMEKGSLRLEANVSVRPSHQDKLPEYKVELKNINSFRFLAEAIDYELKRQVKRLKQGLAIKQETRGYDPVKKVTFSQRFKEEAHDYKYLLEPDIPPIDIPTDWIEEVSQLPHYQQVVDRLVEAGFGRHEVEHLLIRVDQLDWWERLLSQVKRTGLEAKGLSHFLIKNKKSYYLKPVDDLIKAYQQETQVVSDTTLLDQVVDQVIQANPKAVADVKAGRHQAVYFLLGQVRYKLGKVDAQQVIKLIQTKIGS